ncbi:hypothetical protein EUGRSUZ_E00515 [Eucalyptus grandis]|uniref:Uncharacterized protein n=2 Tax=Eucalyptus grandis TaxID=71139 RepID=A0ACC3KU86_EUCGR|nr:hypothetical protein EUGRSUZ_E00515 [Eucalyptus grandis]
MIFSQALFSLYPFSLLLLLGRTRGFCLRASTSESENRSNRFLGLQGKFGCVRDGNGSGGGRLYPIFFPGVDLGGCFQG